MYPPMTADELEKLRRVWTKLTPAHFEHLLRQRTVEEQAVYRLVIDTADEFVGLDRATARTRLALFALQVQAVAIEARYEFAAHPERHCQG